MPKGMGYPESSGKKKSAVRKNNNPAGRIHRAETVLKEAGKSRLVYKKGDPQAKLMVRPMGSSEGLPVFAPQSPQNPNWTNQADRIAERLKNTRNR